MKGMVGWVGCVAHEHLVFRITHGFVFGSFRFSLHITSFG